MRGSSKKQRYIGRRGIEILVAEPNSYILVALQKQRNIGRRGKEILVALQKQSDIGRRGKE